MGISNDTDYNPCPPYYYFFNTSDLPPSYHLPCPPPPAFPLFPDPDKPNIIIDPKHKSFLHNHAVVALTLLACIFVFSCLATTTLLFFYRRLQRRRTLASLVDTPLFASDPAAPAPGAGPGIDPGDPGDDPIHHVWYIRTVGLDEAMIESIAVTQYRAGTGLLGSADCSVCLGDFQDGDLVRLLPKCGHAFHVQCIDTWLRAHVNCPVCRSDVVDPTVPVSDGESAEATSEALNRDTDEETVSETREDVEVSLDVESRESEENEHEDEVFDEIPLSDSSSSSSVLTLQTDSAEREPSRDTGRHRSASVDSPFLVPSVIITILETGISDQVLKESVFGDEQIGKEKERTSNVRKVGSTQLGPLEMVRSLSSSGSSGRSFFFSRSGRSRSSVLPL